MFLQSQRQLVPTRRDNITDWEDQVRIILLTRIKLIPNIPNVIPHALKKAEEDLVGRRHHLNTSEAPPPARLQAVLESTIDVDAVEALKLIQPFQLNPLQHLRLQRDLRSSLRCKEELRVPTRR